MAIQNDVKKGITPIVVMFAVLIVAGFTAAASIQETLRLAVISAAGMVELYLFLYMLDVL
jgi:hypothetical protein